MEEEEKAEERCGSTLGRSVEDGSSSRRFSIAAAAVGMYSSLSPGTSTGTIILF
jgi:hypothetical protein